MSTTGDEFEQPGGDHPARNDDATTTEPATAPGEVGAVDPDHHGQDGGRDTLTVGEAQRAAGDADTQSRPAMSQNNASDAEKVDGIIAQTRVDVAQLGHERVVQVLRQRFEQTGIEVSDADVEEYARRVLEG